MSARSLLMQLIRLP